MFANQTVPCRDKQTILIVDDEKMVTDVIGSLLEKVGYHVICADGGREAVKVVEQNSRNIHLVILDMLMPDMDGRKTFYCIKKIQPKLPVLIASGFNHQEQISDIMQHGGKGFIQKPFTLSQLHPTIQRILSETESTAENNSDC